MENWLNRLKRHVEKKPLVVFQFDEVDWERLNESRYGVREFTLARRRDLVQHIKAPTVGVVFGKSYKSEESYLGLVRSKHAISTLESRVKIERGAPMRPRSIDEVVALLSDADISRLFQRRIEYSDSVACLTPKLSSYLIERLASVPENKELLEAIAGLVGRKEFGDPLTRQEDAIRTALRVFGRGFDHEASSLYLADGGSTALSGVRISEDRVVEHDAREVPGYTLVKSDLTGSAIFEGSDGRLEVFTANRGPLEEVFGVDLIYYNQTRTSIVMLQYKMLERQKGDDEGDWIYRPKSKLEEQIDRMRKHHRISVSGHHEYRLNPAMFYLKFVKRDAELGRAAIILPLDHYEKVVMDPACRGPRNGLMVSYDKLDGRYLRQESFVDLMRSGYIGAYAENTRIMRRLIGDALAHGASVVAARHTKESWSGP